MNILSQVNPFLNKGYQVSILMRHAHRFPLPENSFGNDIPITPLGQQTAIKLGEAICFLPIENIESSSVQRCIQTVDYLKMGLGKTIPSFNSSILGNPGVFIRDSVEAGQLFLNRPTNEILIDLIQEKELPGFYKFKEGCQFFIDYLYSKNEKLRLMVTHDSIMIPILCYMFCSSEILDYRPNFLESILFCYNKEHLICFFRSESATLKH